MKSISKCTPTKVKPQPTLYECGICSCYHPWDWDGDCRDDANRIADPDEYAAKLNISSQDVIVRSWEERQRADEAGDYSSINHRRQTP